jgi:hypothetical protein
MSQTPRASRSSRSAASRTSSSADSFGAVVATFTRDRRVVYGGGKGFGSGALKVDGNIFAMISSKDEFVVKLPAHRVDELVRDRDGTAQRFDPGRGKKMNEWIALNGKPEMWIELATEARQFVGNQ